MQNYSKMRITRGSLSIEKVKNDFNFSVIFFRVEIEKNLIQGQSFFRYKFGAHFSQVLSKFELFSTRGNCAGEHSC